MSPDVLARESDISISDAYPLDLEAPGSLDVRPGMAAEPRSFYGSAKRRPIRPQPEQQPSRVCCRGNFSKTEDKILLKAWLISSKQQPPASVLQGLCQNFLAARPVDACIQQWKKKSKTLSILTL